jgi:alkylated DNA nucleotide flippase Atl1
MPQKSHRSMRERVTEVAERIPAGSWTSYGDVAAIIGSHARPVATCLANWPIPNAQRILTVDGKVAEEFEFRDGRTDDPVELLESEGIRFTNGHADPSQRWRPPDLPVHRREREVAQTGGHATIPVDVVERLTNSLARWDGRGPSPEDDLEAAKEMASAIMALLVWDSGQ